jgi:UDP-N-acetylglucosamine--N-acetylmuramyl-(pentapeptide) pyrophosphoryl-undecaprenol N-acetylglucosamine transferase
MAGASERVPEGGVHGGGLLILLTLGTHEQPFPRALALVESIASREDVLIQHGHTPPPVWCPPSRRFDFLPYDRLVELMRVADGVVCHAGVGTIMTALALGMTPVVVPRLERYGEHVDDHQLQIAAAFSERGFVQLATDGDIAASLVQARGRASQMLGPAPALRNAINEAAALPSPVPGKALVADYG